MLLVFRFSRCKKESGFFVVEKQASKPKYDRCRGVGSKKNLRHAIIGGLDGLAIRDLTP